MSKLAAVVVTTVEPAAIPFKQFYTTFYKCSRQRAYGLIASGELDTFLDGSKRMVLIENARKCVAHLAAKGGAVSPEVHAQKSAAGRRASKRYARCAGWRQNPRPRDEPWAVRCRLHGARRADEGRRRPRSAKGGAMNAGTQAVDERTAIQSDGLPAHVVERIAAYTPEVRAVYELNFAMLRECGFDEQAATEAAHNKAMGINVGVGETIFRKTNGKARDGDAAENNGEHLRRIPLQEFISSQVKIEYLIDDFLRRGWLYSLTGTTGSGKTAVGVALACHVELARTFAGKETQPGKVLYIAGENADEVRERFIVAGEKLGKAVNIDVIAEPFLLNERVPELVESIGNHHDVPGHRRYRSSNIAKRRSGGKLQFRAHGARAPVAPAYPRGKPADRSRPVPPDQGRGQRLARTPRRRRFPE